MRSHRLSRKIHRLIVPVAVAPIVAVALLGALYGTLINFNIELPWLLKMHTGNFGIINLQPFYPPPDWCPDPRSCPIWHTAIASAKVVVIGQVVRLEHRWCSG